MVFRLGIVVTSVDVWSMLSLAGMIDFLDYRVNGVRHIWLVKVLAYRVIHLSLFRVTREPRVMGYVPTSVFVSNSEKRF